MANLNVAIRKQRTVKIDFDFFIDILSLAIIVGDEEIARETVIDNVVNFAHFTNQRDAKDTLFAIDEKPVHVDGALDEDCDVAEPFEILEAFVPTAQPSCKAFRFCF